jgi:opacity protein-like surface antigen
MRKLICGAVLCSALFAGSAAAEDFELSQKDREWAGPAQQKTTEEPAKTNFRVSVGMGIPYGGGRIGGNLETMLGRYFSASAGAGYLEGGDFGWTFGARAYPIGNDRKFNPRLSVYYGTVIILEYWDGSSETDTGASYGAGFDWRFQPNLSVDMDFLYVDYDMPAGFVRTRGSDFKITLGYGLHF